MDNTKIAEMPNKELLRQYRASILFPCSCPYERACALADEMERRLASFHLHQPRLG